MLIVDDEPGMREFLERAFRGAGIEVETASNGAKAIECLEEAAYDIVITDLKMPGRDGMAVLRAAKDTAVDTEVIMVTAYGKVENAVEAMRLGAFDFIAKPFKLEEIERKVDRILSRRSLEPISDPQAPAQEEDDGRLIVGESKPTKQLLKMIKKIGPSASSVLITGPTGVGKELVARAIHDASDRARRPFVALNCAALAPGILESELFGHEKGAFTGATGKREGRFQRAHTGTLFLDEVGEIDVGTQTKLLRVLQEGEFEPVGSTDTVKVDVRIVAATNVDLRQAIQVGAFREDFFYRMNVFSLNVEALANRPDDIPAIVQHMLRKYCSVGNTVPVVDDEVMDLFLRYPWPGNVRELENVIERAMVLAENNSITRDEVPSEMFLAHAAPMTMPSTPAPMAAPMPTPTPSTLVDRTDRMECDMISEALQLFRWNKTKAAEHLGLKRTTLQYKIKKYGLE
jgi:DNA-binding NtrC family response regulator